MQKITVRRPELDRVLRQAAPICNKATDQCFRSVLLSPDDSRSAILVRAGNRAVAIESHPIDVVCGELSAPLLLPAAATQKAVAALSASEIQIATSADSSMVTLSCGRARVRLMSEDYHTYPDRDWMIGDDGMTTSAKDLSASIRSAKFAAATADVRVQLNGIALMPSGDGAIAIHAADGHRAAISQPVATTNAAMLRPCVIPIETVDSMLKLLDDSGTVTIRQTESAIQIDGGGRYYTQLVAAIYPDIRRVIPESPAHSVTVDSHRLSAATLMMLAASDAVGVILTMVDGRLALTTSGDRQATDEIGSDDGLISTTGEWPEIALGLRYLRQAAEVAASIGEHVTLAADSPDTAVLITAGRSSWRSVIMPMKI